MKWLTNNNYVLDESKSDNLGFDRAHVVAECDSAKTAIHIANIHNIHEENVDLLAREEEEENSKS